MRQDYSAGPQPNMQHPQQPSQPPPAPSAPWQGPAATFPSSTFIYTPYQPYGYAFDSGIPPQPSGPAPPVASANAFDPEPFVYTNGDTRRAPFAYAAGHAPPPLMPSAAPYHLAFIQEGETQSGNFDDTGSDGREGETEAEDDETFEPNKRPVKKVKRAGPRARAAPRRKAAAAVKKTASANTSCGSSTPTAVGSVSSASDAPVAAGRSRPRSRVAVISLPGASNVNDIPSEPDAYNPGLPFRPDPERPPIQLRDHRPQLLPAPPGAELDIASLLICMYDGSAVPGADQPTGNSGTGGEVYTCRACAKSYGGKNARSVARRHLQDKHGFPLALQPRRSRWDTAAHRAMDPEDAKEKLLRHKREWAVKNRRKAKAARQAAYLAQMGLMYGPNGEILPAPGDQRDEAYDQDNTSFEEFSAIVFGTDGAAPEGSGGPSNTAYPYGPTRSIEELEAAERALAQQDQEDEQSQTSPGVMSAPQAAVPAPAPAGSAGLLTASNSLVPFEAMADLEDLSPEIPPAPKPTIHEWSASWQAPLDPVSESDALVPMSAAGEPGIVHQVGADEPNLTPPRTVTPVPLRNGHPDAEIAAESLLHLHSTPLRSSPPDGDRRQQDDTDVQPDTRPSLQHRLSFGSPRMQDTPKRQPFLSGPVFIPRGGKPVRTASVMMSAHQTAETPSRLHDRSRKGLSRSVSMSYSSSMPTLGMPNADDPFSEPAIPTTTTSNEEDRPSSAFGSPANQLRQPLRTIPVNHQPRPEHAMRKYASAQKALPAGFLRYAEGSQSFASTTLASSPAKLSSPFKSPFRPSTASLLASPFRSGNRLGSAVGGTNIAETPYSASRTDDTSQYPSSALKSVLRSRRNSLTDDGTDVADRLGILSSPAGGDAAFALGFGSDIYRAPDTPWADVVRASTPRTATTSTAAKRKLSVFEDDGSAQQRSEADRPAGENGSDAHDFVTPAKVGKRRFLASGLSGSPLRAGRTAQTPLRTSVLG